MYASKPCVISNYKLTVGSDAGADTFYAEVTVGPDGEDLFMTITEWQDDPEKVTIEFYPTQDSDKYWQIDRKLFKEIVTIAESKMWKEEK